MSLQHCVSIKNYCMHIDGFTVAEIAISRNRKFPSSQDDLPALEGHTLSPVIAQHLNATAAV